MSRSKPILAVKSGRTPAGARATSSHTGALTAALDLTVDALFAQSGVIRADTLGECSMWRASRRPSRSSTCASPERTAVKSFSSSCCSARRNRTLATSARTILLSG